MTEFAITDDGVLRKYYGQSPDVKIPEHLIHIGTFAFHNCNSVRRVSFPDSVIHIRKSAFQGCKNLEELVLPEYLADIGEGAFCQCRNLKSVTFPRRLEKIGKDAFLGCTALEKVILPDSVYEIGQGAFQGCEKLKSVKLPKYLEKLDSYLFGYCMSLSEIKLPETVTAISQGAFYYCHSLPELHLPDSVTQLSSDATDERREYPFLYRGIHFSSRRHAGTCISMIHDHKYQAVLPITEKISILIQMYHQNPEEESLLLYLREQFQKYVRTLILQNEAEMIQDIIQAGQMIQKETIDELIRYAIEKQSYETQIILTNYKREQFGFETPAERAGKLLLD